MNRVKLVVTLLVLANWFGCIVHCQAEQAWVVGTGSNPARPVCHAPAPADSDGECGGICDWVVTGGYKVSESRVAVPDLRCILMPVMLDAAETAAALPPKQAAFAEWSDPPPEQTNTFLHFCRTALPPRAPSFLA